MTDNNNTVGIKLEWILKWCRVDNDNVDDTESDENVTVFRLVIQAVSVMYQLLFRYVVIIVFFESAYQIRTQIHTSRSGHFPSLLLMTQHPVGLINDNIP